MKKSLVIAALVVPQIYYTITNQIVTRVPQNYPHLKNSRLADSFAEQLMSIDLLIGDEIIRGKSNEPVALISYFGWILSENYKVNEKQNQKMLIPFLLAMKLFGNTNLLMTIVWK